VSKEYDALARQIDTQYAMFVRWKNGVMARLETIEQQLSVVFEAHKKSLEVKPKGPGSTRSRK
jgi:hypothetical protein